MVLATTARAATMAGEKKTEESSKKEDRVEMPKGQGAFAAGSDHDAVTLAGRMMGSFGARTNLIRKQVQYPGPEEVSSNCYASNSNDVMRRLGTSRTLSRSSSMISTTTTSCRRGTNRTSRTRQETRTRSVRRRHRRRPSIRPRRPRGRSMRQFRSASRSSTPTTR